MGGVNKPNNEIMEVSGDLQIDCPDTVTSGEIFIVKITLNDIPISNASVWFGKQIEYTDNNGVVILKAPYVEKNTCYTISVTYKELFSYKDIKVTGM